LECRFLLFPMICSAPSSLPLRHYWHWKAVVLAMCVVTSQEAFPNLFLATQSRSMSAFWHQSQMFSVSSNHFIIPHPIVIGLTYGSMECNKYVCMHSYMLLLVTFMGWRRTKRPKHCGCFLSIVSPSELWYPDLSISGLWLHQRHLAVKQGGGKKVLEFCWRSVSIMLREGSLTFHRDLLHGASEFTSHLKEGLLQIFTAIKNPSPRPGWIPHLFVSGGKHTN
jgi:hypothetical protein